MIELLFLKGGYGGEFDGSVGSVGGDQKWLRNLFILHDYTWWNGDHFSLQLVGFRTDQLGGNKGQ